MLTYGSLSLLSNNANLYARLIVHIKSSAPNVMRSDFRPESNQGMGTERLVNTLIYINVAS